MTSASKIVAASRVPLVLVCCLESGYRHRIGVDAFEQFHQIVVGERITDHTPVPMRSDGAIGLLQPKRLRDTGVTLIGGNRQVGGADGSGMVDAQQVCQVSRITYEGKSPCLRFHIFELTNPTNGLTGPFVIEHMLRAAILGYEVHPTRVAQIELGFIATYLLSRGGLTAELPAPYSSLASVLPEVMEN